MKDTLSEVYLARHGETAWTLSRQHTGRTDIPLTAHGERNALSLGERLHGMTFDKVLVSPLARRAGPPNWPDLARSPRSIPTWRNGIMDATTG